MQAVAIPDDTRKRRGGPLPKMFQKSLFLNRKYETSALATPHTIITAAALAACAVCIGSRT